MSQEATVLGGRYELGPVLGRGGMAEVRRARDTRLGRDVAIKKLRADLAGDPTFQARFRREAQSAAGLNHPTIVSIYDTGASPDPVSGVEIPYIVMELVEGNTLRDVLREGRRILPERAFEITQGVLDALSYSHKAGIIHRDIKPANVMLTKSGQVKVMDFGIARAVADTSATMTQTAAVIGTAQYLSPEQARGETVDARSDLYSAGCLLYELLTSRPPFVGDSPVSVAYQHVRETPVAPSKLGEGDALITPGMDAIVLKALAKSPDERYQSAKEMRDDITRLLSGENPTAVIPPAFLEPSPDAVGTQVMPQLQPTPVTAVQPSPVAGAPIPAVVPPKRRRGGLIALITVLILGAVAALTFGVWAFLNRTPAVQPVTVTNVKGWKQDAAMSEMNRLKLPSRVESIAGDDDDTIGTVIAQDPAGGTAVTPGTQVVLKVNVGPTKATVPDVTGRTLDEAKAMLQRDGGFTNVEVKPLAPDDAPPKAKAGEVVRQDPPGGTLAAPTTPITLYVASDKANVPNVRGLSAADATKSLERAGFKVDKKYQPTSTDPAGTVIKQDPPFNTAAVKGSTVTITIADPPDPSTSAAPTNLPPSPTVPSATPPGVVDPSATPTSTR